jgi:hypothetical protein
LELLKSFNLFTAENYRNFVKGVTSSPPRTAGSFVKGITSSPPRTTGTLLKA